MIHTKNLLANLEAEIKQDTMLLEASRLLNGYNAPNCRELSLKIDEKKIALITIKIHLLAVSGKGFELN